MNLLSKKTLLRITPMGMSKRDEIQALLDAEILEIFHAENLKEKTRERKKVSSKKEREEKRKPPYPPSGGADLASLHSLRKSVVNKRLERENEIRRGSINNTLLRFWNREFVRRFNTPEGNGLIGKDTGILKKLREQQKYAPADIQKMMVWFLDNHETMDFFRKRKDTLPTIGLLWLLRTDIYVQSGLSVKNNREVSVSKRKSKIRCICGKTDDLFKNYLGIWVCSLECSKEASRKGKDYGG